MVLNINLVKYMSFIHYYYNHLFAHCGIEPAASGFVAKSLVEVCRVRASAILSVYKVLALLIIIIGGNASLRLLYIAKYQSFRASQIKAYHHCRQ